MLTRTLRTLTAALLLTALVAVGAVGTSQASVAAHRDGAAETTGPMTVARLKVRPIPAVCDFRAARYVDGVHPDSPGTYNSFAAIVGAGDTAGRFNLQTKVGDLTGDGVADGVIVTACTYGGNSVYFNAFAYRSDGTRIGRLPVERYVTTAGYNLQYPTASITNREVRLTVASFRATDAHCCPSITTNLRLRYNGTSFVRVR